MVDADISQPLHSHNAIAEGTVPEGTFPSPESWGSLSTPGSRSDNILGIGTREQERIATLPTMPDVTATAVINPSAAGIPSYETLLSQNLEWALSEGSRFFEERGAVHESLRRITRRLDELGIPYAVAGGMAIFLHGYRRFTEDVDLLVTREGLNRIHEELDGRGYLRPFAKSKNLRDTETKVKIEFLVSGDFPGDGKPKEIAFPDPQNVVDIRQGIRVLNLPQLISLKIASGMTGGGRTKDIGDVEELVKLLHLPESFSDELHPYSKEKYIEIWRSLHSSSKRYFRLLGKTPQVSDVQSWDELISAVGNSFPELGAMRDAGIQLAPNDPADKYLVLETTDPQVAERFHMIDESEFWGVNDSHDNLPSNS